MFPKPALAKNSQQPREVLSHAKSKSSTKDLFNPVAVGEVETVKARRGNL